MKNGIINILRSKNIRARQGVSVLEYMVLIILILGGLYMMKDTISKGIFARYKTAGDSVAFGRQYDAKRTLTCKTDPVYNSETSFITYDEDCYVTKVSRAPVVVGQCRYRSTGGCPQCFPGDDCCFECEEAIKKSCKNACSK